MNRDNIDFNNDKVSTIFRKLLIPTLLGALSICAVTSDVAKKALQEAHNLRGCEAHSSVILSRVDDDVFRKLGVNMTFDSKYQTKKLYHN
jgi:uncharacterized protein (UPF0371 family)